MWSEWRDVTVEELKADTESSLSTGPFGSSISSKYFTDAGVPVIRGSNLSDDVGTRLNDSDLVFVSADKALEFRRSTVRRGDLIFTCWGTVNQVGLIDDRAQYPEYIISNKQMKLTPHPAKADSLFLYYLFSSPELQERIKSHSIGSSVPGFNLGQLRKMRVLVPELDEQRAITDILGTLDDRIELNRQVNETLEGIARAIFKSWFVDFAPVRAKASGEPSESICRRLGLTPDLLAVFPIRLVDSEIGEIPEGWTPGTIADHCHLNARSWTDKTLPPVVHYIDLANAKNGVVSEVQIFSSSNAPSRARRVLRTGDTIVGTVRPGNRSFALVADSSPQLTGSTGFAVLTPKRAELRELLYFLATSEENISRLSHLADGAAYPAVRPDVVTAESCVVAPAVVIDGFHDVVSTMVDRQLASQAEGTTLAAIRDSLLPKLLSGQLRVPFEGAA